MLGVEECVRQEVDKDDEQHDTADIVNTLTLSGDKRSKEDTCHHDTTCQNGHRNIEITRTFLCSNRIDSRCKAQNDKGVDDVGTQDIRDGQVSRTVRYGNHVHHKLGHRGAESNHRQTNHKIGYTKTFGNSRSTIHQPVGTLNKSDETEDNQHYAYPNAGI